MRFQSCSFKCDVKREENSLFLELANREPRSRADEPCPVCLGSLLSCGRGDMVLCVQDAVASVLSGARSAQWPVASPQWRLCVVLGQYSSGDSLSIPS